MALTKKQEIIVGVGVLGLIAFLALGSGGKTPDNLPVPPSDDDDDTKAIAATTATSMFLITSE